MAGRNRLVLTFEPRTLVLFYEKAFSNSMNCHCAKYTILARGPAIEEVAPKGSQSEPGCIAPMSLGVFAFYFTFLNRDLNISSSVLSVRNLVTYLK